MNRREFLKRSGLLAVAASVPALAVTAQAMPFDPFKVGWEEGWDWEVTRDACSYWWTFMARHAPTGTRYGWAVAEQYLVDRDLSPEQFMEKMRRSVNPYYAS